MAQIKSFYVQVVSTLGRDDAGNVLTREVDSYVTTARTKNEAIDRAWDTYAPIFDPTATPEQIAVWRDNTNLKITATTKRSLVAPGYKTKADRAKAKAKAKAKRDAKKRGLNGPVHTSHI